MMAAITLRLRTPQGDHTLQLPLPPEELDRRLTACGILTGAGWEYRIIDSRCPFPSLAAVLGTGGTIPELNFLARRIERLDGQGAALFAKLWTALGGGMHHAVDLAAHFDRVQLHNGVHTLRDLGRRYLELSGLPDKGLGDYYLTEYGKLARDHLAGVFLAERGFAGFPPEFRSEAYDGHTLPEPIHADSILLRAGHTIHYRSSPAREGCNRVHRTTAAIRVPLCATDTMISRALEQIGAATIDDGVTYEYPLCPSLEVVSGKIGALADTALRYRDMDTQQKHTFQRLIREAALASGEVPSAELIVKHGLLDEMEERYGLAPAGASPGDLHVVLQSSADRKQVTRLRLPASGAELDQAAQSLGVESLADASCAIRAYSLDRRSGMVQRMLDHSASVHDLNRWLER